MSTKSGSGPPMNAADAAPNVCKPTPNVYRVVIEATCNAGAATAANTSPLAFKYSTRTILLAAFASVTSTNDTDSTRTTSEPGKRRVKPVATAGEPTVAGSNVHRSP